MQRQHRLTRSAGTGTTSTTQDQNIEEEIFEILQRVLVHVCCNVYLISFYSTEEYLRLNNISPEDVQSELVEENVPYSGYHEGCMHLPEAPEVAILIGPNFSRSP